MDDRTQGALLLAVGGIALRLGLTDTALSYVKSSLQPPLVLAGGLLAVLGVVALARAFRTPDPHAPQSEVAPELGVADGYDRGHDHDHGPGVAWFLVLPLLALLLIAPPPLGAFAAGRQSSVPITTTQSSYPPLPQAEGGTVPLTMTEFVFRALYDEDRSLDGARVRLSGFVTPDEGGDGYLLTRFTLNCCAADATAVSVLILGDQPRAADTWLEIEGRWQPRAGLEPGDPSSEPPLLEAETVTEIPAPAQPYEY